MAAADVHRAAEEMAAVRATSQPARRLVKGDMHRPPNASVPGAEDKRRDVLVVRQPYQRGHQPVQGARVAQPDGAERSGRHVERKGAARDVRADVRSGLCPHGASERHHRLGGATMGSSAEAIQ